MNRKLLKPFVSLANSTFNPTTVAPISCLISQKSVFLFGNIKDTKNDHSNSHQQNFVKKDQFSQQQQKDQKDSQQHSQKNDKSDKKENDIKDKDRKDQNNKEQDKKDHDKKEHEKRDHNKK